VQVRKATSTVWRRLLFTIPLWTEFVDKGGRMLEGLALWIVGILLFAGATLLFHLFPRAIGVIGLFALILGSTDLGGKIGLFSLETGWAT
jgi:hypothetical protein